MVASILWFRRDLRVSDNPALVEAAANGPVVPLFVLDPALVGPSGAPRLAFLYRSLRALDESLDGRLVVRHGAPSDVVSSLAKEVEAAAVIAAEDFGPYGRARDAGMDLRLVGSAYAVPPGTVAKVDGTPYKVFTPFYKAWRAHGWAAPAPVPNVEWAGGIRSDGVPADPQTDAALPEAGEAAALARVDSFVADGLAAYSAARNFADQDGTSRLSPYLKWGALHPRTVLARLGAEDEAFRRELAWREFYADVLLDRPDSARRHWNPSFDAMPYDRGADASARLEAWKSGRTGFPIVDAGMRQLRGEGWVHNRVRMIVASFLLKDLHLSWTEGARHFMAHLIDADLASNQHGWQWVNGSGTDAAPYFRVFNPITQGKKFDPSGDYVRRWVPELRGVAAAAVHDPAALAALKCRLDTPAGLDSYPDPIVDHAAERADALDRYQLTRS